MTIRKYIQTLLIVGSYLSWLCFLGVFIIVFYLEKLLFSIYLYCAYLNSSDDSLTFMEAHSKLQLYGVLHLTFGFGNTIANLIYINIIINKGRERNCSPHNTGWLSILGSSKITEHLLKWTDLIWNETLKWKKNIIENEIVNTFSIIN